jgi:glycosyltransferase involved in cell wall biosynthesis
MGGRGAAARGRARPLGQGVTGAGDPAGRRPRVCFYAPYLYPVFRPEGSQFAGGAEIQQALLARGLVARGWDVRAVVCDYGQPEAECVEGVTFHKAFPPAGGVPGLRFLHPRLSRAVRALWRADADVYYVRAAGLPAGIASDVARARGAGFVFAAAHDDDARAALPLLTNPRDRWWYRRALRRADLVLAQTHRQQALFRSEFGRASEVVPNAVELPEQSADAGGGGPVVWIGTYKPSKRPEWMIELARRLSHVRFVMAGLPPVPPDSTTSWDTVRAARFANLEVRGFADRERLAMLLREASLFVHTSVSEGFPNTLLEAWAAGLPTVSAFDPDGIVVAEQLGVVADDVDEMVALVSRWHAEPALRRAAGARAWAYVARHHAPDAVVDALATRLAAVRASVASRRR